MLVGTGHLSLGSVSARVGRAALVRQQHRISEGEFLRPLSKVIAVMSIAALTGCASLPIAGSRVTNVPLSAESGETDAALLQLESAAKTEELRKELLFNLERGELLRLSKRYPDSTEAYLLADQQIQAWEETARFSPAKLLGKVGAARTGEQPKAYEGQDYEKVMLTTRLALNRLTVGDLENARVDIKRTHEREAVIAEFRKRELAAAEDEARNNGVKSIGRELIGYPLETLEDPAVLALKNGYQNALSHYLAGFVYEVLNEPGLAAPGYRKATELTKNAPILDEGLRRLDQRINLTHRRPQRLTDVLFLIEAGTAPVRAPVRLKAPIATARGITAVPMDYPAIVPSSSPHISEVRVGTKTMKSQAVVDFNLMARRTLKDEMLSTLLRGAVRAVAKGTVPDATNTNLGFLGGLVALIDPVATEKVDDRMWRTLPERVYLARGHLPPGTHRIAIDGRELQESLVIDGQYAIVPIRVYSNSIAMGDIARFGELPLVDSAPEPEPVQVKPAKSSRGANNKQRSGSRPARSATQTGDSSTAPAP